MKIIKYKKIDNSKYELILENNLKIRIYEDVIINEELLLKGRIDDLEEIIKINEKYSIYEISLKYLSHHISSIKGMKKYLHNKKFDDTDIDKTIDKLIKNNYLNDLLYAKSYILNQIKLSNDGPLKIIKHLEDNDIDKNIYINYLDISEEIWEEKIKKYINKHIKTNKKSPFVFKNSMMINLLNLGYEREMINDVLCKISLDNEEELKSIEEAQIRRQLERKYEGIELERKIKEKLYKLGFFN